MKYLHAMIRVRDLDASLDFYQRGLGLKLLRKRDIPQAKFSLYFLAAAEGEPEIELTHNWGENEYEGGRNFGHLAFAVDNIYDRCRQLMDAGYTIVRPPRDGRMAFVRDPNDISIELLQDGDAMPIIEPWKSMPSQGAW